MYSSSVGCSHFCQACPGANIVVTQPRRISVGEPDVLVASPNCQQIPVAASSTWDFKDGSMRSERRYEELSKQKTCSKSYIVCKLRPCPWLIGLRRKAGAVCLKCNCLQCPVAICQVHVVWRIFSILHIYVHSQLDFMSQQWLEKSQTSKILGKV